MTKALLRRDASSDDLHKRLKVAVEVKTSSYLWVPADTITFVPPVLSTVYGDGRALFRITTINDRPAYWIVRGDSGWQVQNYRAPDDAPDFGDFTDDVLNDLEGEFGSSRCGYNGSSLYTPPAERVCTCEECADTENIAKWPEVDDSGGCSWGRMNWPAGFETVPHPYAPSYRLLAVSAPMTADGVAAR
jgi:hypothetical protein